MRLDVDDREFVNSGHMACPGCGAVIALRLFARAMGESTILVVPASCTGVFIGVYPQSVMNIPVVHAPMAAGASVASGLRASLDRRGDTETNVVAWAGDGGTFDIGFQALSGAVERNENFIYVCYDNEAYMNTGIQCSSSTPYGAWTTTTPDRKKLRKKNIVEALAAHRIPYAATASIAFPEDLIRKVKKAKTIEGTRFLHVLATCPPGWRIPSEMSVKIARTAVQANIFPLYEVEDGIRYTINYTGPGRHVQEYFQVQGRFNHLKDQDFEKIQATVEEDWELLKQKAGACQR